jgi:hypothetical protein
MEAWLHVLVFKAMHSCKHANMHLIHVPKILPSLMHVLNNVILVNLIMSKKDLRK